MPHVKQPQNKALFILLALFLITPAQRGNAQMNSPSEPKIVTLTTGESVKLSTHAKLTLIEVGHKITREGDLSFIGIELTSDDKSVSGRQWMEDTLEWKEFNVKLLGSNERVNQGSAKLEILFTPIPSAMEFEFNQPFVIEKNQQAKNKAGLGLTFSKVSAGRYQANENTNYSYPVLEFEVTQGDQTKTTHISLYSKITDPKFKKDRMAKINGPVDNATVFGMKIEVLDFKIEEPRSVQIRIKK